MKWKPNHIVPLILLVTVITLFVRGFPSDALVILFMIAVYAIADIVQSEGEKATLFYWCLYGCAVGGIYLWRSCAAGEWVNGALYGACMAVLLFLARRTWKGI